jgi:hypothetical protein
MKARWLSLAGLVASLACNGLDASAERASDARAPAIEAARRATLIDLCRSLMLRERDCSALFVAALVAERVRLDRPAGTVERDLQQGRAASIACALAEYRESSPAAAIERRCSELAESLTRENAGRLVFSGRACLAREGCQAFATCAAPINAQL